MLDFFHDTFVPQVSWAELGINFQDASPGAAAEDVPAEVASAMDAPVIN